MENRKIILPALKAKAEHYKVPLALADAIICVESSYNQWAIRYEKKINMYQLPDKFSKLNRITLETEVQLQKFSYGLFQILGSTSRWLNYTASFMRLCEVETNITVGLRYIEKLMARYSFEDDVISAYNAGSAFRRKNGPKAGQYVNQEYVDKVKSFMAKNV